MITHDMKYEEVKELLDTIGIAYKEEDSWGKRKQICIGGTYLSIIFSGEFLDCIYVHSCDVTIDTNFIYYDAINECLCAYNCVFVDVSRYIDVEEEREGELGPEDYALEPEEFEERYGYRPC